MITYLQGTLVEKNPAYAVIDIAGVGYHVWIPLSSYQALGESGSGIQLFTHLVVREDALQIYGFATRRERSLFQLLIGISGVGPKLAQTILSGLAADQLERAVAAQDSETLTAIPGVGRKTAQRLILELKDKITLTDAGEGKSMPLSGLEEEAVLALVSLGYPRARARKVVSEVMRKDASGSVESIIRQALSGI
ncbi:MAG TPA: Holliday junction branch migration protein RuvA [bacterium]|nr:Holliday junction branch migration protein RuvA [bacterium]